MPEKNRYHYWRETLTTNIEKDGRILINKFENGEDVEEKLTDILKKYPGEKVFELLKEILEADSKYKLPIKNCQCCGMLFHFREKYHLYKKAKPIKGPKQKVYMKITDIYKYPEDGHSPLVSLNLRLLVYGMYKAKQKK